MSFIDFSEKPAVTFELISEDLLRMTIKDASRVNETTNFPVSYYIDSPFECFEALSPMISGNPVMSRYNDLITFHMSYLQGGKGTVIKNGHQHDFRRMALRPTFRKLILGPNDTVVLDGKWTLKEIPRDIIIERQNFGTSFRSQSFEREHVLSDSLLLILNPR